MVDHIKIGVLRRKLAKASRDAKKKKDLDVDDERERKRERDADKRQRSIETGGQ